MMTSESAARRHPPGVVIALGVGLVGSLVAVVLALLTFGVQATASPHQVPLAVGPADASAAAALAPLTDRVAGQGGDSIAWRRVGSRAEAEAMLDRKEIYGALLFSPGPGGLSATVLLSGAVNPNASAIAEPVLMQVAEAVTSGARSQATGQAQQPAAGSAVTLVMLHPTSGAGRVLPLAASALLWLAALVTNILVLVAGQRTGGSLGRPAVIAAALWIALLGSAVVIGLGWWWDSSLPITWELAGFLVLVGAAFALFQAGVLRWLGFAGMALLGPLYLMAPAVAGMAPELLDPVYRAALWSWTPFRFSAEAVRSLLFLGPSAADVQSALPVFAGIALLGLLLVLTPKPRPAAPKPAA
jgi:hypothetical protein